jgi:hypothetical protein
MIHEGHEEHEVENSCRIFFFVSFVPFVNDHSLIFAQ